MPNHLLLLILSCTLLVSCNSTTTKPTGRWANELPFRTPEGDTIQIRRQYYDVFSLIHPVNELLKASTDRTGKYSIPIHVSQGFAEVIQTEFLSLRDHTAFFDFITNDLLNSHEEEKTYVPIWSPETFAQMNSEGLSLGNSRDGYLISGYSKVNLPMKVYILRGYFLSPDSLHIIKLTGLLMIEPTSSLYDQFEEVKEFLYDLKVYFLTTVFRER